MPYAYVETKYPQWVTQLPTLKAAARTERRLLAKHSTRESVDHINVYWVPYLVEDVLTLLDYEEKQYAKAMRQEKVHNFAYRYSFGGTGPITLTKPQNAALLTLPRADLEEQYIVPAIAASAVEGPEPEVLWPP